MVGRITPLLVVLRENRPQIQSLANRLPDQVCNVPRRHKVLHRGRKQPHLIHVPRAKNLAHTLQRIELLAPCPLRFLLLSGQAPRWAPQAVEAMVGRIAEWVGSMSWSRTKAESVRRGT